MRTVTYGGAVSLDGFLAASDGAIDWLHFSKDVQQVIADYWKDVDTILMGRKTYEVAMRAQRAPGRKKPKAAKAGPPAMRTYVFSRTLTQLDDSSVELVTSDAAAFVRELKERPGREICLMGGGELARSLLAAGLVERVGLNIHPILLGTGVPVFHDMNRRVRLTLLDCRVLEGGCVLANYQVNL